MGGEYTFIDFYQLARNVTLMQSLIGLVAMTPSECKVVVARLFARTVALLHPEHIYRRYCAAFFLLLAVVNGCIILLQLYCGTYGSNAVHQTEHFVLIEL